MTEPARSRAWWHVTLSAAACVTLLDAALLQRKHGLFTGGFLATNAFGTLVDGLAFVGLAALLNLTLAAPLAAVAFLLGRRLRLHRNAGQFAAFCAAVLPLAIADFVTYQVWWYLGDAFDFHLLYNLTGRRSSEVFAVVAPLMSRPLGLFALALAFIAGLTWTLHRMARRADFADSPSPRFVIRRCGQLTLLSSLTVTGVAMASDSMSFALRWTPAGQLFTSVLNPATDFDRDGYGLLRDPRDLSPFNADVQPYALDVPGNNVDENGLAGDLPASWPATETGVAPANAVWADRPPVILFVLESVRADAVGGVHNGRRVTPVMDSLAANGLKVQSAWSHNGFTRQSRYHILTGSLVYGRGSSTLLDDFKDHGYEVGYFSGQNDDFGSLGIDYQRVDKFYDARNDVSNRYSTYTTAGSLAVPHAVVEQRIREYLAGRRATDPLFLYVNFHDTHYPYHHAGLENLLGTDLLAPSLISPARRSQLHRTYLNATANVDGAMGRVIDNVASHAGRRPAVVVISDHGESLFEQGFLGHGYALNSAQTQIPFIVEGLPLKVNVPFGQTDLRHAINDALASGVGAGGDSRPTIQPNRDRRVFQYLGSLDSPMQVGWITQTGQMTYDFRSDRVTIWDGVVKPRDLAGPPRQMFEELIHTFESILVTRQSK